MKKLYCLIFLCSLICADKHNDAWKKYERNITQKPHQLEEQAPNFQDSLNNSLAQVLEFGNSADQTSSNFDFNSQSFELKNMNLLYENQYGVLLFQKEFMINQEYLDYSNGLINRYQQGNILFGLNGFADRVQEKNSYSLGTELGFGSYFKAYTNYYIFDQDELNDEQKRNLQLGFAFVLPIYTPLGFDLSKDDEKVRYTLNYSPFSIFNFSLSQQKLKNPAQIDDTDTSLHFGFKLNYKENFLKQLKRDQNKLFELDQYEFYKRKNL
ncbi:hypothetical protein GW575_02580 [Campylobacter sp. MIT 19-121]|uniref:inverse autotransporter beta domain-containing protein n=1 Tax=Campylobacter sp. MIT 19-121 TaxID=2703906 RepID=UPI0013899054|nr:inverse autotransporter beta domain-containing protein [Campylobacter sp. MIT 19-121]NDJ26846.1 hypothetical protein [Campylobacter sp. MIT 19-121]